MSPPIAIVAGVIRDAEGRVLLVRKHGTAAFLQPGGKREAGEDDVAALARELREELGCAIVAGSAGLIGVLRAPAANEAGREVVAHVYAVRLDGAPVALAEIAELAWVDPAAPGDLVLAPLTRDHILPALSVEPAMVQ